MADVSIIVSTNADQVGKEIKGMSGDILSAAQQAKALTSAMEFLDKAVNSNKISHQQYSKAIQMLDKAEDRLYASIGQTTTAVEKQAAVISRSSAGVSNAAMAAQKLANAQRMAGKSTNRFGLYAQQVGYQVGDFFVQVQSGTDALVAFGQQGTQLAGLLPGLAGAIIGIGLSVSTAILSASSNATDFTFKFREFFAEVKKQLEPLNPLFSAIGAAFKFLGNVIIGVANGIINSFIAIAAIVEATPKAFKAGFSLVESYARVFELNLDSTIMGIQSRWQGMLDLISGSTAQISTVEFGEDGAVKTVMQDLTKFYADRAADLRTQADAVSQQIAESASPASIMSGALSGAGFIDLRDYFSFGPGKGDDKKGGGKSQLESLIEEQRQRAILLKLFGEERILKEAIFDITNKLGDEAKNLSKEQIEALAKVNVALEQQEKLYEEQVSKIQGLTDTIGSSFENAFMSVVDGTQSAKDAFKSMAASIIKELYRVLVVQQLVGSFDAKAGTGSGIVGFFGKLLTSADGNVFSNGSQIKAFANGGVVGGPTYFPMSGGKTGLMGEAGPEAIMPLKRGANGKLGVEVQGGGGSVNIVQNFNISANGDESVKRIVQQQIPRIAEATKAAVVDSKRRGGSYGRAFG
jgi:hypothetical protein